MMFVKLFSSSLMTASLLVLFMVEVGLQKYHFAIEKKCWNLEWCPWLCMFAFVCVCVLGLLFIFILS